MLHASCLISVKQSYREMEYGNYMGSTWNVNGLQKVAVAKTTKGSHYDAISVMAPTLTVAEQFYSSNGVPHLRR